jgi:4-hydroxy-4-methyl-2-oxoglutarate aldolase
MRNNRRKAIWVPLAASTAAAVFLCCQQAETNAADDPVIAGFEKVALASVADAVDQVVGQRGFMNYDMRPAIPGRIVGRAATALVRPAPPEKATPQDAVRHSVEMIDNAPPGTVGVIVMADGLNVAAIGGLMGTAAKARGMAGMVLDGGVRDVKELRDLNLPVYARSITPATAVGRYASVSSNQPVECGGVLVTPGDIIVADEDGVVRVPRDKEQEVLKVAQEIDDREGKMVPLIQQLKSLSEAIRKFNRI